MLEKVFELQSSTPLGLNSSTPSTNTKSDDNQPSTAGSELVPYNICNPISMPVDINAILNTRKEQQALIQFTPSELKSLEWLDFVKLWKEYVSRYTARFSCLCKPATQLSICPLLVLETDDADYATGCCTSLHASSLNAL